MSTSNERRDVASRSSFIASRINLQNRKQQMQKNINNLLKEKSFETINDSIALRTLKVVEKLLSLLFTRNSDIKQELININKKLKKIENNTFKIKLNMRTYVVAMTKKRKKKAKITSTKREQHVVEKEQQKILTKIKKKKTLMIKINNEKKKRLLKTCRLRILCKK